GSTPRIGGGSDAAPRFAPEHEHDRSLTRHRRPIPRGGVQIRRKPATQRGFERVHRDQTLE
ncbi:MAG: hypothetical protein J0H99_12190, partial [Rhodospirillales bacterium]|nr:hypothetical protein [Rhodospirillales bacterium]